MGRAALEVEGALLAKPARPREEGPCTPGLAEAGRALVVVVVEAAAAGPRK
jgi:hypothetical protein